MFGSRRSLCTRFFRDSFAGRRHSHFLDAGVGRWLKASVRAPHRHNSSRSASHSENFPTDLQGRQNRTAILDQQAHRKYDCFCVFERVHHDARCARRAHKLLTDPHLPWCHVDATANHFLQGGSPQSTSRPCPAPSTHIPITTTKDTGISISPIIPPTKSTQNAVSFGQRHAHNTCRFHGRYGTP